MADGRVKKQLAQSIAQCGLVKSKTYRKIRQNKTVLANVQVYYLDEKNVNPSELVNFYRTKVTDF